MPSSRLFLEVGLDPTSIAGTITKAQLLQMFSSAAPDTDIGYVIRMAGGVLPDAVSYPELVRFVAVDPTNLKIYFHDGSSWREFGTAGGNLDDGSVALSKLAIGSAPAVGQVIAVKADLSGFDKALAKDVIQDGTFALVKLVSPGASGDYVLMTNSGTRQWVTSANLKNYIGVLDEVNLPVSGVTPGTYGSATEIPILQINDTGVVRVATTVANPAITPIYAAAHAGATSLTPGTPGQVVWVEDLDTSSILASNVFTVPVTGVYEVACTMYVAASPSGANPVGLTSATVRLHKNRATSLADIPASATFDSTATTATAATSEGTSGITLSFQRTLQLTAADALEVWVTANGYPTADLAGVVIGTSVGGPTYFEYLSHFSIKRIA